MRGSILDGSYDMIGFDPRGTGNTIPFTCGIEPIAHQKQKRQDVRHQDIVDGIDVDELDEYTFAQLAEALEPMFEADQAIAEECAEAESETGEFVGTSFVARDMLEIVDALGQGPLLNYYGMLTPSLRLVSTTNLSQGTHMAQCLGQHLQPCFLNGWEE